MKTKELIKKISEHYNLPATLQEFSGEIDFINFNNRLTLVNHNENTIICDFNDGDTRKKYRLDDESWINHWNKILTNTQA